MNSVIKQLASKFYNNKIAIFLFRPIYRHLLIIERNKQKKQFNKNGLALLEQLNKTLTSKNILYWLEFGTLLGAYRDHDFIKHDYDLDIGIFFENYSLIRSTLESAGFKLKREFKVGNYGDKGVEQTYEYNGVYIDIFFFHKLGNTHMICNSFSKLPKKENGKTIAQVKQIQVPYTGFKTIDFKGMFVKVPYDEKSHLEAHYGKNFMIPNSNFDYKKEATNITWLPLSERKGFYYEY